VSTNRECVASQVDRYKGLRRPKCNKGTGCTLCWAKYRNLRTSRSKVKREPITENPRKELVLSQRRRRSWEKKRTLLVKAPFTVNEQHIEEVLKPLGEKAKLWLQLRNAAFRLIVIGPWDEQLYELANALTQIDQN
jgi:hypothetical protein